MNYVELKYVRLVSVYLDGFKDVGNHTYRFRCPLCGDSQRKTSRTRGYFFSHQNVAIFKCHNCGASMGLGKFLSEVAPSLASEYRFDLFRDQNASVDSLKNDPAVYSTSPAARIETTRSILGVCDSILSLNKDHHARAYLDGRRIPESQQRNLYYCDNIQKVTAQLPEYKDKVIPAKDAIMIPFRAEDGTLMYIQCRFFDDNFRYMTLQVAADGMKIWGLDRVDWNKPVYVMEGAFDAMFVDNAIAVAGVSILSVVKYLGERSKDRLVLVFDKDYTYNPEVNEQLKRAVDEGHYVVLFDEWFRGKDVNAQIKEYGATASEVSDYLSRRSFCGLTAKLELSKLRNPETKQHGIRKESKTHTQRDVIRVHQFQF